LIGNLPRDLLTHRSAVLNGLEQRNGEFRREAAKAKERKSKNVSVL
jgi:hypothetical protein